MVTIYIFINLAKLYLRLSTITIALRELPSRSSHLPKVSLRVPNLQLSLAAITGQVSLHTLGFRPFRKMDEYLGVVSLSITSARNNGYFGHYTPLQLFELGENHLLCVPGFGPWNHQTEDSSSRNRIRSRHSL